MCLYRTSFAGPRVRAMGIGRQYSVGIPYQQSERNLGKSISSSRERLGSRLFHYHDDESHPVGNKTVLEQYNCTALRKASQKDARNTTGLRHTGCVRRTRPRHGLCDAKLCSHEERVQHGRVFSRKALMRMTTLASRQTVGDRIKNLLGEDPQFTAERGKRMLQMMLMLSLMLSTMAS